MPASTTSLFSLGVGALLTLPVALVTAPRELPGVGAVLAVVALGLLCTAVGFTLYYWLIDQIGEGRAALANYLTPAFALLYGTLLLGEALTFAAIVGLVLIVAGAEITLRETGAPEVKRESDPERILLFIRARGAKAPSLPRRKLPDSPRRPLAGGQSGFHSSCESEVDQQDDEERRAYDVHVEHYSRVPRIVVARRRHLADVYRGGAQEPDGGRDHGRSPEVAPDPVRQNP